MAPAAAVAAAGAAQLALGWEWEWGEGMLDFGVEGGDGDGFWENFVRGGG